MEQEKSYININDDWRIGSDAYNLILEKKKIITSKDKTTKRETWYRFGFYSTHKQILHVLVEEGVREIGDLAKIVEKINDLHKMIESLDLSKKVQLCQTMKQKN